MYLVFDRYVDYSIKGVTSTARVKEASRHHQLSRSILRPSQKVVLTVTYNKVQLIDLIVESLCEQRKQLKTTRQKLVVTGSDPVTVEINDGIMIAREDTRNTHEEADVIIIHQLMFIVKADAMNCNINVISDDTDVFVLLIHFYQQGNLTCPVTMEATSTGRKYTDKPSKCANAQKHCWSTTGSSHLVKLSHCGSVLRHWKG